MSDGKRPICRNCDHWAQSPNNPLAGFCLEPRSQTYHHQRSYSGQLSYILHSLPGMGCKHFASIPEATGYDKRTSAARS